MAAEITEPMAENDEALTPDGWDGNSDIFAMREKEVEDDASELPTEEELKDAPTTEQKEDAPQEPKAEDQEKETPTIEQPKKLTFKAKVDHKDLDVSLDESEIPSIYQKAQNHDRLQKKLAEVSENNERLEAVAKLLGYESGNQMLDSVPENYKKAEIQKLVDEGVNEAVAEETIESRMSRKFGNKVQEKKSDARDFRPEIEELNEVYPDMAGKPLPEEVIADAVRNGKRVLNAYQEFRERTKSEELEQVKKENKVLKQNADAAQKAPVRGVSGGGDLTDRRTRFEKDFLSGFDSEY